jgi:hypothetical protein
VYLGHFLFYRNWAFPPVGLLAAALTAVHPIFVNVVI